MYKLFWKIFFTFWAIILCVELLTAWVTANFSESELHPILEEENLQFIASTTQAVSILTSQGVSELREWLKKKSNLKGVEEIFVVDENREEITGKTLPASIKPILERYYFDIPVDHFQPIKHTLALRTSAPDGKSYLIISTFAHPAVLKYVFAPQRVLLGVIISGIICYLLARYFTKPLTNLRRTTQKLTVGQFDTTSLVQLKNRNDEFGALAIDFDNMAKRLSELLDSKRQLLRDISHELNSPLARIRVAIELARNKYKFSGNDELDRIEKEIERLEVMIRELMTFVKIRSTDDVYEITPVNIRQILDIIVEDAQYEQERSPEKRKIKLYCPYDINVKADERLLHRALDNIVRNACYYSPENSEIIIRCYEESEAVHISIEDQGPGVPDNMLGKIFQPFVRVSSARESDTGGSGIGLAIAKEVVDIHNGTVTAANKKNGSGLVVTVVLPLYSKEPTKSAA